MLVRNPSDAELPTSSITVGDEPNISTFSLSAGKTWLHVGAVGASLVCLGLSRLVFNVVGQHVFGLPLVGRANLLLSVAMLAGLPSSAGLAMALARFLPIYHSDSQAAHALRAAANMALLTTAALVAPVAFASRVLVGQESWLSDFTIAGLWALLYAVYAIGRAALFAKSRVGRALVLELFGCTAFGIALILAARWHDLWWIPFALYPVPMSLSVLPALARFADFVDPLGHREFLRFAVLALLGSVAGQGVQYASTLVGGAAGGASLAGTWATLVSLASPVLLLPRTLSTSFLPRLAGLSVTSKEEFELTSREHQSLSSLLALPASVVLVLAWSVCPAGIFPLELGANSRLPWMLLCFLTYVTSRSEPLLTGNAALGFAGPNAAAAGLGAAICALSWWALSRRTSVLVAIAAGLLIYAVVVPVIALVVVRWRSSGLKPYFRIQPGDLAMSGVILLALRFPASARATVAGLAVAALGFGIQCWIFFSRRKAGRKTS